MYMPATLDSAGRAKCEAVDDVAGRHLASQPQLRLGVPSNEEDGCSRGDALCSVHAGTAWKLDAQHETCNG
eukprot:77274-Chlamydomonas_euryale.AAC.6